MSLDWGEIFGVSEKGMKDLSEVAEAHMESDGTVSVIKRRAHGA